MTVRMPSSRPVDHTEGPGASTPTAERPASGAARPAQTRSSQAGATLAGLANMANRMRASPTLNAGIRNTATNLLGDWRNRAAPMAMNGLRAAAARAQFVPGKVGMAGRLATSGFKVIDSLQAAKQTMVLAGAYSPWLGGRAASFMQKAGFGQARMPAPNGARPAGGFARPPAFPATGAFSRHTLASNLIDSFVGKQSGGISAMVNSLHARGVPIAEIASEVSQHAGHISSILRDIGDKLRAAVSGQGGQSGSSSMGEGFGTQHRHMPFNSAHGGGWPPPNRPGTPPFSAFTPFGSMPNVQGQAPASGNKAGAPSGTGTGPAPSAARPQQAGANSAPGSGLNAAQRDQWGKAMNTLGLPANATFAEAKQQYRKLALQSHPDRAARNGVTVDEAKNRFQSLSAAMTQINDLHKPHTDAEQAA